MIASEPIALLYHRRRLVRRRAVVRMCKKFLRFCRRVRDGQQAALKQIGSFGHLRQADVAYYSFLAATVQTEDVRRELARRGLTLRGELTPKGDAIRRDLLGDCYGVRLPLK